mmetsp:Transcript_25520/g.22678  ORF Transcript_25520/g.22678 Transcript_25520/m.22678 type:complete len:128 (+) Transcript_25520:321-704(+)
MKNKETDNKVQLLENRINNLKREEIKAQWKVKQATQKEELFKKIKEEKIEQDKLRSIKLKERENEIRNNQNKISVMRTQISSNITQQRNNVYNQNRMLKKEVINQIYKMKGEKSLEQKINTSFDHRK